MSSFSVTKLDSLPTHFSTLSRQMSNTNLLSFHGHDSRHSASLSDNPPPSSSEQGQVGQGQGQQPPPQVYNQLSYMGPKEQQQNQNRQKNAILRLAQFFVNRPALMQSSSLDIVSSGFMSLIQDYSVDLYHQDVARILFMFLQFHAILWHMGQEWGMPELWSSWTKWTLITLLDFSSFLNVTPLVSSILVIALCYVVPLMSFRYLRSQFFDMLQHGDERTVRHCLRYVILNVAQWTHISLEFLMLPAAFTVFKQLYCTDSASSELIAIHSFDGDNIKCYSLTYWLSFLVVFVLLLPYAIGFFVTVYNTCSRVVVFRQRSLYEQHIRTKELEFLFGINDNYSNELVFLVAPFRRWWAYSAVWRSSFYVLLAFTWLLFSPALLDDPKPQAGFTTFVMSVQFCLRLVHRQYRHGTLNTYMLLGYFPISVTCMIGFFVANEVTNAMFIPSTLSVLLSALHLFFVCVSALVWLFRYYFPIQWMVTMHDVQTLSKDHREIVSCLNRTKKLIEESSDKPLEFISPQSILDQIMELHAHQQALNGTIAELEDDAFTIGVEDGSFHPTRLLQWSIQDLIEELALLHASATRRGFSNVSSLTTQLNGLRDSLHRKDQERILFLPAKKIFLQRLLVLAGFVKLATSAGIVDVEHLLSPKGRNIRRFVSRLASQSNIDQDGSSSEDETYNFSSAIAEEEDEDMEPAAASASHDTSEEQPKDRGNLPSFDELFADLDESLNQ